MVFAIIGCSFLKLLQIDKHIRKLDTELARFEGELKQQQMEQLNPSTGVMGTASAGPGNTPQMKGQSGTASGASSLKRDKDSQGRGECDS